jgi:serine/threonine-protein kinase HipA
MDLREARVFFKDRQAGLLAETAGGGTRFTYQPDWTGDIACALPAVRREHDWARGLHPFFEHLGPEGWLRERQARNAHIVEDDDFGLLLRYGRDCIGAVSILPTEGTFIEAIVTEAEVNPGRTVSGVQKKLLVVKTGKDAFQPAAANGPAPYIAKFNPESEPTLVRNERLSLAWTAAVLGKREVNTAEVSHIAALDQIALIVTRFDRGPGGEKYRLEDCAQILGKPRGRDYAGKYDGAYEDIAGVIDRYSARPAIDKARFLSRLVAYALIGNCDAHLKNFSLLESSDGLRLSPAYDVVNTALYPRYDQLFALAIEGKKHQLSAIDGTLLRRFGLNIGLPERAVEQIFTEITRNVRRAEPILQPPAAEPPDGFVSRFKETVSNACLRILAA